MEVVGHFVDDDRVSGIVPAGAARGDGELPREDVDELAFACGDSVSDRDSWVVSYR